jgi:hypothetical protein
MMDQAILIYWSGDKTDPSYKCESSRPPTLGSGVKDSRVPAFETRMEALTKAG